MVPGNRLGPVVPSTKDERNNNHYFGFPDGSRRNAARRIRDLYVSMFCAVLSTGKALF